MLSNEILADEKLYGKLQEKESSASQKYGMLRRLKPALRWQTHKLVKHYKESSQNMPVETYC